MHVACNSCIPICYIRLILISSGMYIVTHTAEKHKFKTTIACINIPNVKCSFISTTYKITALSDIVSLSVYMWFECCHYIVHTVILCPSPFVG